MTTKSIKLIVFLALLVHGIGHLQGVVASLGVKINNANGTVSWLLKGLGESANRTICLILFLLTAVFGILTALGFKGMLVPETSWQILAIFTAFASTICLVLFPNVLAMFFNKVGAISVNLFIYYSILFARHWPSVVFED